MPRLVALAIIVAFYAMARLPDLSGTERAELAGRFRFARQTLPELSGDSLAPLRPVHPSLERIAAWISSVGAAVALNDLDGDGLPNDVVYVDTRTDRVDRRARARHARAATSRSRSTRRPCPTTRPRWPRWAACPAT